MINRHTWISTCGYPVQDVDIYWRISSFDLGISISIYLDILRDIHMQHLDIYMWISCSRCGYPYASVRVTFGIRKYLHEFIDIHGYLHLDILFKMWIIICNSGYAIWYT